MSDGRDAGRPAEDTAEIVPVVRRCSVCERPGCRRDRATCPGPPATDLADPLPPPTDRLGQAAALRARIDGLKREIQDWEWLRAELDRRVIANQVALVIAEEQLAQVRAIPLPSSGVK